MGYTPRLYACANCTIRFRRTSARRQGRKHLCDTCEQVCKWCPGCDTVKLRESFSVSSDKRDGKNSQCKACHKAKWTAVEYRRQRVDRTHGLVVGDWAAMFVSQGGRCAICQRKHEDCPKGLVVDHCHTTNDVRALLCGPCNVVLGLMQDEPERLRSAADYLDKYRNHMG